MTKQEEKRIIEKLISDLNQVDVETIKRVAILYGLADIIIRKKHLISHDDVIDCYFEAIDAYERYVEEREIDGKA